MTDDTPFDRPPDQPWDKGHHEAYTCLTIEVKVCQDANGRVWSIHDFQSPEDMKLAGMLQQGGVKQVAFALLTEAIRREAFLDVLAAMSENPEYVVKWLQGTPEEKQKIEHDLAVSMIRMMNASSRKMALGIAKETLAMIGSQIPNPDSD